MEFDDRQLIERLKAFGYTDLTVQMVRNDIAQDELFKRRRRS